MLVRECKRLAAILGPLLLFAFLGLKYHSGGSLVLAWPEKSAGTVVTATGPFAGSSAAEHDQSQKQLPPAEAGVPTAGSAWFMGPEDRPSIDVTHNRIYSLTTSDGRYFNVSFGEAHKMAINPNIIPHPQYNDTWIIIAQQQRSDINNTVWFAELSCNAVFTKNGNLECMKPPLILPVAATIGGKCSGKLDWLKLSVGPHDARVFWGPNFPLTIYGSNSRFTCFGQWIQDFRVLVDWGFELFRENQFRVGTEIQRPISFGRLSADWHFVEKNFFVFWDSHDTMYAHYDIFPKRSFARLSWDGSVGADLAPAAAVSDDRCMASYIPKLAPEMEDIHQATNSLRITLCERADPSCTPSDTNTFIMTIFHHKSFHDWHGMYEPYVLLFRQTPPFDIYAIGGKPLWIQGRGEFPDQMPASDRSPKLTLEDQHRRPRNHTEMIYVTSMAWKAHGQRYHGFVDDVLFLGFGVEDERTAAIDVRAADLLKDLRMCHELGSSVGWGGGGIFPRMMLR